ncbi:MAG: hypothetical protein CSA58_00985 [Micrococcales bacterium]|nr:MAG: hypothetical protein CSA58_00985 [Micrococcales bacterium]
MHTHIIGIDGRSGAGKTGLAALLAAALSADQRCSVLAMEDLYPGWHGLRDGITTAAMTLMRYRADGTATYPVWDWHRGRWGAARDLAAADVLIVEGVGALAARIRPFLDTGIYCDADDATRWERVHGRDGPSVQDWWQTWAGAEDAYLRRDDPRTHADLVLTT